MAPKVIVKSKKQQHQEQQAAKHFVYAAQMCQANELVTSLKFCHSEIEAKPQSAGALAALLRKGFFRKLAEQNIKDMDATMAPPPSASFGTKLKGRLRKLTDLPAATKFSCCRCVLPTLPEAISPEFIDSLFKLTFGIN